VLADLSKQLKDVDSKIHRTESEWSTTTNAQTRLFLQDQLRGLRDDKNRLLDKEIRLLDEKKATASHGSSFARREDSENTRAGAVVDAKGPMEGMHATHPISQWQV
jgi:hypothetical protein